MNEEFPDRHCRTDEARTSMEDALGEFQPSVFRGTPDGWEIQVVNTFVDSVFGNTNEGIRRVDQKVARKRGSDKVVALLVASCLASQKANLTVYVKTIRQAQNLAGAVQLHLERIGRPSGRRFGFAEVLYDATNLVIKWRKMTAKETGLPSSCARFSCVEEYQPPRNPQTVVVVVEDGVTPEDLQKNKHTTIISFVPTQVPASSRG